MRIEKSKVTTMPPGTMNYNTLEHTTHDAYRVSADSPVYVANRQLVLKKHTTKTSTHFTRDQMVIGDRMKGFLPFEFSGLTATPTQLFDLGYYTFETGIEKWPWMVVCKSVFRGPPITPELANIKSALSNLWIKEAKAEAAARGVIRAKEKEEEKIAKYIEQGYTAAHIEELRKQLDEKTEAEVLAIVEQQKRLLELPIEKAYLKSGVMPINPDDLGPVIPPLLPLTEKQQSALQKKQICPDCRHRAEFLAIVGAAGGVMSIGGALMTPQQVYCGNCGSKFNVTGIGGFGAERI